MSSAKWRPFVGEGGVELNIFSQVSAKVNDREHWFPIKNGKLLAIMKNKTRHFESQSDKNIWNRKGNF